MKVNKKAPSMHRSEDDYLLTTKLFCGKCGAMMTGVVGTSKTAGKYRYYKCNQAKQHRCDKKTVRKEWIEDLVIAEIEKLLANDDIIEELADRIYELQMTESNTTAALQAQYDDVCKKLRNLAEAIAQGAFSSETKKLLNELEEQKSNLESELYHSKIKNPILTKEQIVYALGIYKELDLNKKQDKQRLIDGFVNSIYLYDDYFVITFNYKSLSETVTLEQVNNSPLTSTCSPTNWQTAVAVCLIFILRGSSATTSIFLWIIKKDTLQSR